MAKIWDRAVLIRKITESTLIVLSILLALSDDAWLNSRNQAAELDGQLASLARDFETTLTRVEDSHGAASRGVESGKNLILDAQHLVLASDAFGRLASNGTSICSDSKPNAS